METIKLSEVVKEDNRTAATSGYVVVDSSRDGPYWRCVESDGPQPTVEDAIAKARQYDWEPPFFIAKVGIVAKVVE